MSKEYYTGGASR